MGSCVVWWAAPTAAPALVALLDEHERERHSRFRRAADAGRYLAAHALVRLALDPRDPAALRFDRTCRCGQQHGKPRLVGGGPAFSLTHAGDLVGVAVHDGPVGVDVERVRPLSDLAAMAAHACSPAETAEATAGGPESFFRLWTRKEAVLKATGDGLSTAMSDLTVGPAGVTHWPAAPGPIWLTDLSPAPGHPAAVAGLGATAPHIVQADGNALLHR